MAIASTCDVRTDLLDDFRNSNVFYPNTALDGRLRRLALFMNLHIVAGAEFAAVGQERPAR
jgi:hypothetical protein